MIFRKQSNLKSKIKTVHNDVLRSSVLSIKKNT